MILTCPSCSTRYVVKDGAIPPGGRKVRCASCKHSWHQDPDATTEPPLVEDEPVAPPVEDTPAQNDVPDEQDVDQANPKPVTEPPLEQAEDNPGGVEDDTASMAMAPESYGASFSVTPPPVPEAEDNIPPPPETPVDTEEPAEETLAVDPEPVMAVPADVDHQEEAAQHDAQDFGFVTDQYEDEGEPRSRRGLIVVAILLLVGASAAAFYFFAPNSWKQQVGLAQVETETPLELVLENYTREALPSGNQLLTLRGRVINPTDVEQDVPVLRAELRDAAGAVVHDWTIQPPKNSLDPGESASFNNVQTDVPPGGDDLVVTLDAPEA